MTRTISVFNNESDAQWILSAAENYSYVSVEELIEGKNHHITLSSNDTLGKEMIKRLISTIERNWPEDEYMIS